MNFNKLTLVIGTVVLLSLASIGWVVLFVQNPVVLAKARWKYQQAVWEKQKIPDLWIMEIDNHKIEMSSKGEVIVVQ